MSPTRCQLRHPTEKTEGRPVEATLQSGGPGLTTKPAAYACISPERATPSLLACTHSTGDCQLCRVSRIGRTILARLVPLLEGVAMHPPARAAAALELVDQLAAGDRPALDLAQRRVVGDVERDRHLGDAHPGAADVRGAVAHQ